MMNKIMYAVNKREFVYVDDWVPLEQDIIFKHTKGAVILPVSRYYEVENAESLDYFRIAKKSHNSEDMRQHCTHYLNYFTKFYDPECELLSIFFKLKYLMDLEDGYTKDAFLYDIDRYILSQSILYKITLMNRDNYTLSLNYINKKEPGLQYNNKHASIMMKISLLMNILIPLIGHFAETRKININLFALEVFDKVLHLYDDVDIYNKLYETSSSNVTRTKKYHSVIWGKQDIRGKNTTTHTLDSVQNIVLNMMPKYCYNGNLVSLNFSSIKNNIGFQITNIGYEFDFIPLSSSKRDEDNNSEFDKFESYLTKQDESLYIQNKVNCQSTMKHLENVYGNFTQEEVDFYIKELSVDNKIIMNNFQKEIIFNLFYKYFGDPESIKAINRDDYVKLMLMAKNILQANNMVILPYIISSKINRLVLRKNINKKELSKLESSPYFSHIVNKYKNEKILKQILSIIATILSSEFQIVDFQDEYLHGKPVETIAEIISEEVLMYTLLI
ncbi:MAG: hypothetical protein ACRDD7_16690 [Peptostreptococcaceae bacterium]